MKTAEQQLGVSGTREGWTRTVSSAHEWRPVVIRHEPDLAGLREKIKRLTPDNQTLVREAKSRPAPDSWIHANDNPFEPE